MSNMNLLVVILKHEDLVSEICKELVEEGIHGGTIVDGTGMASVVEKMDDLPIFDVRYLKPSVFNNLVFDFHSLKLFRTACLRKALRRHIRSNAHFIHLSVTSCKFLCVPTI